MMFLFNIIHSSSIEERFNDAVTNAIPIVSSNIPPEIRDAVFAEIESLADQVLQLRLGQKDEHQGICLEKLALSTTKEGSVFQTSKGMMSVLVAPDGRKFVIPTKHYSRQTLEDLFPGKDFYTLRYFICCLQEMLTNTHVKKDSGQVNFGFDDAVIHTLSLIHKHKVETALDVGCGDGAMTFLMLVAGVKSVHAYDLLSDGKVLIELLKKAVANNLLTNSILIHKDGQTFAISPNHIPNGQITSEYQEIHLNLKTDLADPKFALPSATKFDMIWAGRFLHILMPDQIEKLMPKLSESLAPGGLFCSVSITPNSLWNSYRHHPMNQPIFRLYQKTAEAKMHAQWQSYNMLFGNIQVEESWIARIMEIRAAQSAKAASDPQRPITNLSFFTKEIYERIDGRFGLAPVLTQYLNIHFNFIEGDLTSSLHAYHVAQRITKVMTDLATWAKKIGVD